MQGDRPRARDSEMGAGEPARAQRHAHSGVHALREAVRHDGQHRDHSARQAKGPVRGHRQGNALRLRRLVRLSQDVGAAESALGGRRSVRTRRAERPAGDDLRIIHGGKQKRTILAIGGEGTIGNSERDLTCGSFTTDDCRSRIFIDGRAIGRDKGAALDVNRGCTITVGSGDTERRARANRTAGVVNHNLLEGILHDRRVGAALEGQHTGARDDGSARGNLAGKRPLGVTRGIDTIALGVEVCSLSHRNLGNGTSGIGESAVHIDAVGVRLNLTGKRDRHIVGSLNCLGNGVNHDTTPTLERDVLLHRHAAGILRVGRARTVHANGRPNRIGLRDGTCASERKMPRGPDGEARIRGRRPSGTLREGDIVAVQVDDDVLVRLNLGLATARDMALGRETS